MGKKRRIKIDHTNCEMILKQRGPHFGLFCAQHGSYIKWLGAAELAQVRQMDIGVIMETKCPQ